MQLSIEEIKKEITDGNIKALSLDTSIFDEKQNGFEFGLLKRLRQFNNSETSFVLSDIVLQEIETHIRKSATETRSALKNALKEVGNPWAVSKEIRKNVAQSLLGDETPETISRKRLDAFIEGTGATVIKSEDHVAVGELVGRYFGCKSPFENKDTKKYEFPDALAVMALDSWAKQNGTKILVVSKDGGWVKYCKESTTLVSIDDLGDALGLFQRETALYICKILSDQIRSGDPLGFIEAITDAVNDQDSKFDFETDACSSLDFEADWPEGSFEVLGIQGMDDGQINLLEPLEIGDDFIVAQVKVDIQAEVICDYSFYHHDSIDRDYVSMGSVSASKTVEFEAVVLVTLRGTMSKFDEIEEVEVVKQRVNVYFGEIEPDWMNESRYDEE